MNILLVNKDFEGGGAATACRRLFQALDKSGKVDVKVLVQQTKNASEKIIPVLRGKFATNLSLFNLAIEKSIFYFFEASKDIRFAFSSANYGNSISSIDAVKKADIIHIHWINQGFLSLKEIDKIISLNKPIVWTLHDMWPFTGGCHYSGNCEKYKSICGNCPFLKGSNEKDLSYYLFNRKKEIFQNSNISWIGCSKWMATLAQSSNVLTNPQVKNIFNPIDIELYKPIEKATARKFFDLPINKKIILFGAAKISDKRKGLSYLLEALNILDRNGFKDIMLGTFGKNSAINNLKIESKAINYISDENKIAQLYSAADVFVLPSLEDNLPNTVMESLTCGTPVVAFNIGGIPEMVKHTINGYLAKVADSTDLANGIEWVLNKLNYSELSANARNYAINEFSEDVIANKYIELYQNIINK